MVGVEVNYTLEQIKLKFGQLTPKIDAPKVLKDSREFPEHSTEIVSKHFPPVIHKWSCDLDKVKPYLPPELLPPKPVELKSESTTSSIIPIVNNEKKDVVDLDDLFDSKEDSSSSSSTASASSIAAAVPTPDTPTPTTVVTTTESAVPRSDNDHDDHHQVEKLQEIRKKAIEPVVKLFQHELLQSVSIHIFAKRPIEPITSYEALKREFLRRIVSTTLSIRLNVLQRKDPLFTAADFIQLNWPREGCAVCSFDITTDTAKWSLALYELRRLALFGITTSELQRYKQSLLAEYALLANNNNNENGNSPAINNNLNEENPNLDLLNQKHILDNEKILQMLMESKANGHTFLDPKQLYQIAEEILMNPDIINIQDIKQICIDLAEHIAQINVPKGIQPAAIVICAPETDRQNNNQPFSISTSQITDEIMNILAISDEEIEPLEECLVPFTLIPDMKMESKMVKYQPKFVPLSGKAFLSSIGSSNSNSGGNTATNIASSILQSIKNPGNNNNNNNPQAIAGVIQRKLNNGLKVNLKPMSNEPQKVSMRMYIPGGRLSEDPNFPGSVLLGARTMQEGGAFPDMSRERVEMFCIDHAVNVEIIAKYDALVIDVETITTTPSMMSTLDMANSNIEETDKEVTGFEAAMQVLHIILTDFLFENDAFHRAKQSYHETFDAIVKGLETACQESLTYSLTSADPRFLAPNHHSLEDLTLPYVEKTMRHLLRPENVEISIAGDIPLSEIEKMALKYLGTIPSAMISNSPYASYAKEMAAAKSAQVAAAQQQHLDTVVVQPLGKENPLAVYLPDNDSRAVAYVTGPAPNKYGFLTDQQNIASLLQEKLGQSKHREHPLFANVALQILKEVCNRRLFSVVREERQLTYDASIVFSPPNLFHTSHMQDSPDRAGQIGNTYDGLEAVAGGWYVLGVTARPETALPALKACQEALASLQLRGPFGVLGDSVTSAKRTLLSKFRKDLESTRFWVEQMAGTQIDQIPNKSLRDIVEFETVLQSVTVQDVQGLVELMNFTEENMTTCVGITAPTLPDILKRPAASSTTAPSSPSQ